MATITSLLNDTFDSLSRRAYGVPGGASQLRKANPGIVEPIPNGATIVVPQFAQAVLNQPQSAISDALDEVQLKIDANVFRFWDSIVLTRSIDSAPSMQVEAVWEPDNVSLRKIFKPLSFLDTEVYIGGDRFFTGTMLTPIPKSNNSGSSLSAPAYGRTGVLSDCTVSGASVSLEFNDSDLRTIAQQLLQPFGIDVIFEESPGVVFEQVALEPSSTIMGFLIDLAQQRGLVIGETKDGKALFRKSTQGGVSVAALVEGQPPVTDIIPNFNSQNFFSHITAISPSDVGITGDQFTFKNPHLNVLRPHIFKTDDTGNENLRDVVLAKAARMYSDMVSWDISVPTWRDAKGDLWEPNTLVTLIAPRAMIYNTTTLLIRTVTLNANQDSRTATLNLVLPGAFAGTIPKVLPWDE